MFLFFSRLDESITLFSPNGDVYSDLSDLELRPIRTQMSFSFDPGKLSLNSETNFANLSNVWTFGCQASHRVAALFIAAWLDPPIHMESVCWTGVGSKTASLNLGRRTLLWKWVFPAHRSLISCIVSYGVPLFFGIRT